MADGYEELRAIARSIGHRLAVGESIGVELPPRDKRPVDSVTGETLSDYATKKWIRRENERTFSAEPIVRPVVNPVTLRPHHVVPSFLHRRPIEQF